MKLYAFNYCGMTEEGGDVTISLHFSREGAEEALKEHKQKEYEKHLKYVDFLRSSMDDEEFSLCTTEFGVFQQWSIGEVEVLP